MKYFIFAMLFILSAPLAYAQGFFMPSGALSSAQDKLKPLNKDVEKELSGYNQRRYKVIDGRVIALPNEPQKAQEIEQESISENTVNPEPAYQMPVQDPTPTAEAEPVITPELQLSESDSFSEPTLASEEQTVQPAVLHEPAFLKPQAKQEDALQPIMPEIEAPETAGIDDTLPKYKNRYAQYLNDLKIFQKNGKLPRNKELESVMQSLSKRREITLFEGEID